MSSSQTRALALKITEVLEGRGNADIVPPDIAREVRRRFPDECAAVGTEAVERFIIHLVHRRLKPSNSAPRLPGFDVLPEHLPIEIEGGIIWRATVRMTRDELLAYNQMLIDGWQADRDAQRAFQTEMRRLIRLLDQHGVDRLEDIR